MIYTVRISKVQQRFIHVHADSREQAEDAAWSLCEQGEVAVVQSSKRLPDLEDWEVDSELIQPDLTRNRERATLAS